MEKCDAFYLPSNIGTPILFTFEFGFKPSGDKEGFYKLVNAFKEQVGSFGKTSEFPKELLVNIEEEAGFDRLLSDCEFIPEKTFFLLMETNERFFSVIDGRECRMCGNNGDMTVFKGLSGDIMDIVATKDAMKVFTRIH